MPTENASKSLPGDRPVTEGPLHDCQKTIELIDILFFFWRSKFFVFAGGLIGFLAASAFLRIFPTIRYSQIPLQLDQSLVEANYDVKELASRFNGAIRSTQSVKLILERFFEKRPEIAQDFAKQGVETQPWLVDSLNSDQFVLLVESTGSPRDFVLKSRLPFNGQDISIVKDYVETVNETARSIQAESLQESFNELGKATRLLQDATDKVLETQRQSLYIAYAQRGDLHAELARTREELAHLKGRGPGSVRTLTDQLLNQTSFFERNMDLMYMELALAEKDKTLGEDRIARFKSALIDMKIRMMQVNQRIQASEQTLESARRQVAGLENSVLKKFDARESLFPSFSLNANLWNPSTAGLVTQSKDAKRDMAIYGSFSLSGIFLGLIAFFLFDYIRSYRGEVLRMIKQDVLKTEQV